MILFIFTLFIYIFIKICKPFGIHCLVVVYTGLRLIEQISFICSQWCIFTKFLFMIYYVLGKDITEDWKEQIDRLISALQSMWCPTVSSVMHLLFKHKEKCEPYIGIFSDEQGERLHQEMQTIEKRFQKCLNKEMLAEYSCEHMLMYILMKITNGEFEMKLCIILLK